MREKWGNSLGQSNFWRKMLKIYTWAQLSESRLEKNTFAAENYKLPQ
jgi:hypothetical protein